VPSSTAMSLTTKKTAIIPIRRILRPTACNTKGAGPGWDPRPMLCIGVRDRYMQILLNLATTRSTAASSTTRMEQTFDGRTLNSQRKEVSYAESIIVMSKGCPEQRLTPAVVCAEKCMTAYLKGGIYMASTVANTRSDGDRSGEFLTCILVLQVRLYFYMYISYM
jgi:hypothetical protein